jgi:hypothetical protein
MKFIIGLILGASITALVLYKKPEPIASTTSNEIVTKFKDLSENEARQYAEAKTAEEKLKAADALYGKMMIIFLADLALKLQPIHQVDPVMMEQTMMSQLRLSKLQQRPRHLQLSLRQRSLKKLKKPRPH